LSGEIATRKNVVKREEMAFVELDCHDLDITADKMIHDVQMSATSVKMTKSDYFLNDQKSAPVPTNKKWL
jgi:PBP1b-binding outer membrane lipoprotein LpoB